MAETAAVAAPIQLPVIDISNPDDPAVGKAMIDAAAKYGFFYVDTKGSDFLAADIDRTFELVCKYQANSTANPIFKMPSQFLIIGGEKNLTSASLRNSSPLHARRKMQSKSHQM